jgi:TonB-linked SusC/RagA family outer membrane protein
MTYCVCIDHPLPRLRRVIPSIAIKSRRIIGLFGFCLFSVCPIWSAFAQSPGGYAAGGAASASLPGSPQAGVNVLSRVITVNLENVTVATALDRIGDAAGVALTIDAADRSFLTAHVSFHADRTTVRDALARVLFGTGFRVEVPAGGMPVVVRDAPRRDTTDNTGTITGRVVDNEDGVPLFGATIRIPGTTHSAVAGADGHFKLSSVPPGTYTLVARQLGYTVLRRTVQVVVGETTNLDLRLAESTTRLDEIVTTATGAEQRFENGNTIGVIDADSLVGRAPITDLSDLLNARVPGVQVFTTGGLVGTSPQIDIRGEHSLSLSNQPLLIIDGVRTDNSQTVASNGATGSVAFGFLNDIPPEDIESIEVIKGPAAAALYGTDAANGIILVKTKRGVVGRTQWTTSAEHGILSIDRNEFPLNYYGWGHSTSTPGAVACTLLAQAAGSCVQDSITSFSPLRNPQTTPIGTGSHENYVAQVQGGGAQTRYFASILSEYEVGVLKLPQADAALYGPQRDAIGLPLGPAEFHPNADHKIGLRGNVTTAVGSTSDISFQSAYVYTDQRSPAALSISAGEYGPGYRDANNGWAFGEDPGPAFIQRNKTEASHLTLGVAYTGRPTTWLATHETTGLDATTTFYDQLILPGEEVVGNDPSGLRQVQRGNSSIFSEDIGATATATLAPFLVSKTSIGGQYNRTVSSFLLTTLTGLNTGSTTFSQGGSNLGAFENSSQSYVFGGYGQEEFGFWDRLFVQGAVRFDGSDAFGTTIRPVVYPKLSASWLLSQEPFWPRIPGLTSLRLRGAWGTSGSEPTGFQSRTYDALVPVLVDGTSQLGAVLGSVGNPALKPERQEEGEGGFDADLWNGRVSLEGSFYTRITHDAISTITEPASLNYFELPVNLGTIRNWGYEATANVRVVTTNALEWDLMANGSINHNRVVSINPQFQPNLTSNLGHPINVAGYALGSYFDYPITSYADANHDGVIESNEVTLGSKPVYMGTGYPTAGLTAGTSVSLFRQMHVSVTFDHRGGVTLLDNPQVGECLQGYCLAAVNRNTSFADQARVAALKLATGGASGFYANGAFTRLRELALTYDFPNRVVRPLRIRTASITLSGRNIALWTNYKGGDPEVNAFLNPGQAPYQDYGGIPPAQYWLARINLGL